MDAVRHSVRALVRLLLYNVPRIKDTQSCLEAQTDSDEIESSDFNDEDTI